MLHKFVMITNPIAAIHLYQFTIKNLRQTL